MKKIACRYAIVHFLPYTETGEFANVGVVVVCPTTGFFGYKLETRKFARYTRFFRDLDKNVYLRAIGAMRDELERISRTLECAGEQRIREVFAALTHPREAMLRFGQTRSVLVDDPAGALEQLYGHYVDHDFVTQEYREHVLEQRVQQLIKGLNLTHPFKEEKIGDEEFAVRFPLVQTIERKHAKIIKPFFLAQDNTIAIYNHGDLWLAKLNRLHHRRQLPKQILFTVEAPEQTDTKRYKAYDEVCQELSKLAEVETIVNEQRIKQFAMT